MQDLYEPKAWRNTLLEECYFCSLWQVSRKTGQCNYCKTQNNPPKRKINFGKSRGFAVEKPKILWRGSVCSQSKLTEKQVEELRQIHSAGGITYRELGQKYNVSAQMIWNIVKRKWWKHL